MERRRFLQAGLIVGALGTGWPTKSLANSASAMGEQLAGAVSDSMAGRQADNPEALRIGLTPVFLDDQAAFLNRWRDYLTARIDMPVIFVQRASYREITELIRTRQIDVAWMCGYPFMMEGSRLELLAVPLHLGRPEYHSYLIVRDDRPEVSSISDLASGVFAFSDPNSFSGSLYPRYLLHLSGVTVDTHFRRSFFTWSHRKVVEAVAEGLADGGSVAGYVWETLSRIHPEITGRTRVVSRSPAYGFPPFVARRDLDRKLLELVRHTLMDMRIDNSGASLLRTLNLDGFVPGNPGMFEPIAQMAKRVDMR